MAQFTYILGAGASVKALPLAKTIKPKNRKILGLYDDLEKKYQLLRRSAHRIIASENQGFIKTYMNDLEWLVEKHKDHETIDDYAKFCSLNNPLDLVRLKSTLSIYFSIEQTYYSKPDNRYLNFLTRILKNPKHFPKRIKILNWNYDYQLQIAAGNFVNESYYMLPEGQTHGLHPLVRYYPCTGLHAIESQLSEFSMVHLNGIAGFSAHGTEKFITNPFLEKTNDINITINKLTEQRNNKEDTLITFPWEINRNKHSIQNKTITIAKELAEHTNYLIVIGYSFPYYNNEIDKEIFNSIKIAELKEIYFQDPFNDGQFLKKRYNLPRRINITPINADQFHVPFD